MSTKPVTIPQNAVFEAIHKVMHRYRAAVMRELRDNTQALAPMEHRALAFFAHTPGATLSDMVEHSGKDKAQLARLVRDLRDKALLDASPDPHDRRITRLTLSQAGEAMHKAAQECQRAVQMKAVTGLSHTECIQLTALMEKILTNLKE